MLVRAGAIWSLLLLVAIAAGGARTIFLEPLVGEQTAHVVGTLVGAAVLAGIIWCTVSWIILDLNRSALLRIGIVWFAVTVVFEFGFGHYMMGNPWSHLLADYNILTGRLWLLVLVTVLLMPLIAGELQRRARR